MGLLSRLRNASEQPPAAEAQPLWRRGHSYSLTAGDEMGVAIKEGRSPTVVPAYVLDFVQGCDEFRPLEAHLLEHAEKHGWSTLQLSSLRDWLPPLMESELLVSTHDVHARCRKQAGPDESVAIASIGFPTGGERVEMLSRALLSFAENLRRHGRRADLLVADSSRETHQRDAFRQRVQALAGAHKQLIGYAGEEEKRAFAAALIRKSGCPQEAVEFALFDPLDTGFICGANRNAILLHGAGHAVCSVDDDVVCRLSAPPTRRVNPALFSGDDPFARWLFANAPDAHAAAQPIDMDFLAQHEALLGKRLGALLPEQPAAVNWEQANDEILRRIEACAPWVRATFSGHVGDPGIPSSAYYLYYKGANRDRLTASEAHYRSVFASRSVLTLVEGPSIGDASVSPGMAMGLDQRSLFPPSFPVLHAEDFIFGATIWQCCPDSVLGHLPHAIAHEPAPGKPILLPWELNASRRAVIFEFAHLMRRLILIQHLPAAADTAGRMTRLGRALVEIGDLPVGDFRHFLGTQTLEHESERLAYLERQLRQNPEAPDFWREDVQHLIDHARESLGHEDFDIPLDLKAGRSSEEARRLMQTLISRYGALLETWPALFAAAQELREEGRPLFLRPE